MDQTTALYAVLAVSLTTYILGGIKPLFDTLPFAAHLPQAAYNAILRLIGVLLNGGILVGLLASHGAFNVANWYWYLVAAIGQQGVSHLVYVTVKSGAASAPIAGAESNRASVASQAPAPVSPLTVLPADTQPSVPVSQPAAS